MEIILAAIVSFVVTAVVGKFLIPALVRLKAGQSIKEIGPKYADRKGGYTQIVKIGPRRGDAAEMAIIKLV